MKGAMEFNLKRFFILIRNDIYLNRVIILIASALIILLIITISILLENSIGSNPIGSAIVGGKYSNQVTDYIYRIYSVILIFFGIRITANIFKDINNEVNCPVRLLIPASMLEKYLSRVLLSTVFFAVGLTALFSAVFLIYAGLSKLFLGYCNVFFNPFSKRIFYYIVFYFILQAPFILGAAYFKKNPFIKTFLCFIIFYVLLRKFCIFMGINFMSDYYVHILYSGIFRAIETPNPLPAMGPIGNTFKWAVHIYLCYFFILSCWITGYIRLKEKEI